jgi:hypothetical protein
MVGICLGGWVAVDIAYTGCCDVLEADEGCLEIKLDLRAELPIIRRSCNAGLT